MSHPGFLTHVAATQLPYTTMGPRLLLGIEEGIRVTWQSLIGDATILAHIMNCTEVDITFYLELELDKTLSARTCPTFTEDFFRAPIRGNDLSNFDGTKLEKCPDLVFYLKNKRSGTNMSNYDAVFAECKILDSNSKKTLGLYAKEGLNRFVNGDYAWAMPHALMIGYVRTLHVLPTVLENYFFHRKTNGVLNDQAYNLIGKPEMCKQHIPGKLYRVCHTIHKRTWGYPPTGKRKPGDIAISHLWLDM